MIDICMLTCNRKRITETSIREIKARTTSPHRLIVCDNGSTDGTPDMLVDMLHEDLIDELVENFDRENRGVHWGFNTLLQSVESDLYVCTDNDLVPQSPTDDGDWLSLLLALMDDHPDYAAIACLPHYLVGDSLEKWLDGAGPIINRGWCGAALRLMNTSLVRTVGGWRGDTKPARNNEERWICGKLAEVGYKVGYARDARCIHLWGEPELGEDAWGYPQGTEHGHREVWPPPDRYNWDRLGVDWETCQSRGRLVP